jgi:hypothetical protein
MSPVLEYYITKNGWKYMEIELPLNVANFNTSRKKKEILVYNYSINKQPDLFT